MSYHTSVSDKLRKGFGNLTDSLFGTGPEAYMKGGLYRSRIGANEELTRYRGLQSRDLETAYGRKNTLGERLAAEEAAQGAGPEAAMRYNSFLSGQPHSTWMRGAVTGADYGTQVGARQRLRDTPGMDPNFVNMLEAGVTALTSGRLERNPLELQGLQAKNTLAGQLGQEKLGKAGYENQQAGIEFQNAITEASTSQQKLDIIQEIFEKFNLSMDKAEHIPSGIVGTGADGQEFEMSLADFVRLQGGPTSGKPSATAMKLGFTGGQVKELAKQKVLNVKEKILKIKEQIKILGLTGKLKQQEIDSLGKHWDPSGSVKMQTIVRTVLDLKDRKHTMPNGKRKKWDQLSWDQQEAIITAEMDRLYRRANLGTSPGSAASDQDMLNDLNKFVTGEGDGSLSDELEK